MTNDNLIIGCNGYVAAIRISDGEEVWKTSLGEGGILGLAATSCQDVCVLVEEGRIYAGCHGWVFCLEPSTGRILWKNGLKGLGHNDVTLARPGQAIQFVATKSRS